MYVLQDTFDMALQGYIDLTYPDSRLIVLSSDSGFTIYNFSDGVNIKTSYSRLIKDKHYIVIRLITTNDGYLIAEEMVNGATSTHVFVADITVLFPKGATNYLRLTAVDTEGATVKAEIYDC